MLLVLPLFFGFDPSVILQGDAPSAPPASQAPSASPRGQDDMRDFVATVLADTEDTWRVLFRQMGREYREPKLVLFNGSVQSACGISGSATGPFYCPRDQKVYLDLDFFGALRDRFRAPGDFAQAYVIAHEVGHHVQHLLGISDRVLAERRRGGAQANAASVRLELQADCLAGVWAHHAERTRHVLEAGDVEEALGAAAAIGDDPAAAAGPGPGGARDVHARHVPAARAVVHARHRVRRPAPMRHVRRVGLIRSAG